MSCRIEEVNGRDWLFCDDEKEAQARSNSGNPIKGCWQEQWKGAQGTRWVENCASLEEAVDSASRDDELRETYRMNKESDDVGLGLPKLIGLRFAESWGWVKTNDVEEYVASCREPLATPQVVQADLGPIDELIPLLEQYIAAGRMGIVMGAVDTGHTVTDKQVAYGLSQARLALDGLRNIQSTVRLVDLSKMPSPIQREYMRLVPDLKSMLPFLKTHLKNNILHDMGKCFGTSIAETSREFSRSVTSFLFRYPEARSTLVSTLANVVNGPAVSAVKNAGSGLGPWGKVAVGAGILGLAAGAAAYFWLTSDE